MRERPKFDFTVTYRPGTEMAKVLEYCYKLNRYCDQLEENIKKMESQHLDKTLEYIKSGKGLPPL